MHKWLEGSTGDQRGSSSLPRSVTADRDMPEPGNEEVHGAGSALHIALRSWVDELTRDQESSLLPHTVTIKKVMPKRLLELEPGSEEITLVESKGAHTYACPSYCWGGDQSTITTKSNVHSHMRGIRTETLS
jgi:hypothetical protein